MNPEGAGPSVFLTPVTVVLALFALTTPVVNVMGTDDGGGRVDEGVD